MAWDHCGASHPDNAACSVCGLAKRSRTVRLGETRQFDLKGEWGGDAEAQARALRSAHEHGAVFCEP